MEKKLLVIKIGTSSLTAEDGSIDRNKIESLVSQAAVLKQQGNSVILVTSGSISAGFRQLGFRTRPTDISAKQASAAVGQGLLMEEYTRFFQAYDITTAQILLTRDDFRDKRRYTNAFNTLGLLLKKGAVPIINENDTVAVEELKLGDNDTLSAQVAAMMHAHLLVLLTDIDGLYTGKPGTDPNATFIPRVDAITPEIESYAGGAGTAVGTGGMMTKIRGAHLATRAGVPVFICSSAVPDAILKAASGALDGSARGTLFTAASGLKTRLQWMAFYAEPKGTLLIDKGAFDAVVHHNHSLLPAGIRFFKGDFRKGDVVEVFAETIPDCVGHGIVNYSTEELSDLLKGDEKAGAREVIHIDNWVSSDIVR